MRPQMSTAVACEKSRLEISIVELICSIIYNNSKMNQVINYLSLIRHTIHNIHPIFMKPKFTCPKNRSIYDA